jgi:hypothetical protein
MNQEKRHRGHEFLGEKNEEENRKSKENKGKGKGVCEEEFNFESVLIFCKSVHFALKQSQKNIFRGF